jgi:protein SCO1/2
MTRRRQVVAVAVFGCAVAGGAAAWRLADWRVDQRSVGKPAVSMAAWQSPEDLTSLVDQDGRPFSFRQLQGRTVSLNFIFTNCPVSCPLQTRALTQVQHAVAKAGETRARFVSVTMDPTRDTPELLRRYAAAVGANLANWSFVTGSPEEIAWLHQHFNAQVTARDGGQFDHRVAVYLLDAGGRLMQTYAAQPLDEHRLAEEMQTVDRLFNKS